MTIGERLIEERKKKHMTQEDLGEKLGVSRQAVSKWEGDVSLPDTENLIRLSTIFGVTVDYILKGEEKSEEKPSVSFFPKLRINGNREKHSERMVMGLPLWSLGVNAKGFFALGFKARGVFSLGFVSRGVFSLGCFSMGVFSIGMASIGLAAIGAIALGLFACGAISLSLIMGVGAICVSPLSLGAISVGEVSVGALSRGRYFAYGDNASAMVAIGKSKAEGLYTAPLPLSADKARYLYAILSDSLPERLKWTLNFVRNLFPF